MLAQPTILFGSIPINNPFPTTLVLSTVATVAFGVELAIATFRVHPRKWLYVLLAGCVALGVMLMAWSGYYALLGPTEVDPLIYPSTVHNHWYDIYLRVWEVHIAIALLTLILLLVNGLLLRKQKA